MQDNHIRLKAKCLDCGLHFIVCTWYQEKHSKETLHCPECGQHDGDFLTWAEAIAEPIWGTVPGQSSVTPDILENATLKKITIGELVDAVDDQPQESDENQAA